MCLIKWKWQNSRKKAIGLGCRVNENTQNREGTMLRLQRKQEGENRLSRAGGRTLRSEVKQLPAHLIGKRYPNKNLSQVRMWLIFTPTALYISPKEPNWSYLRVLLPSPPSSLLVTSPSCLSSILSCVSVCCRDDKLNTLSSWFPNITTVLKVATIPLTLHPLLFILLPFYVSRCWAAFQFYISACWSSP